MRAPTVTLPVGVRRFCHKCSCWHGLDRFRNSQRSCARSLDKLRERAAAAARRSAPPSAARGSAPSSPTEGGSGSSEPSLPSPLPPGEAWAAEYAEYNEMLTTMSPEAAAAAAAQLGGDTMEDAAFLEEILGFDLRSAPPPQPPLG